MQYVDEQLAKFDDAVAKRGPRLDPVTPQAQRAMMEIAGRPAMTEEEVTALLAARAAEAAREETRE